jgi:SAM-dependent methyltransferase
VVPDKSDQVGLSEHYQGEPGREYFRFQNQGGSQRGHINARKFSAYVQPEHTTLDFGCGNGSLLSHLSCRRRIGVEINPAAREAAQALGIEVHATLAEIPDHCIDVAISNHALEHVRCPFDELRTLHDKLKPTGLLVLCLPIDDWRTQKHASSTDSNHHLYSWTPLLLGNLLAEAGYAVERAWVYTHAWPPSHWQELDARLPVWLFDLVCRYTAWHDKRRQVMAVARAA